MEFPASVLLAVAFLVVLFCLFHFAGNSKMVRWLTSPRTAIVVLAVGAVLLALEGTFSWPIHQSAAFVVYTLILLASLSLTVLKGFKRKARLTFTLCHLGMLVIVWASLFGAPDVQKAKMMVGRDIPANMAYRSDGTVLSLPFRVCMEDFRIDCYDDGVTPKQFTSQLLVDGKRMQTSVNNPCSYKGYTLFQFSYDVEAERYTVLQLVRDPWLPVVFTGMALLSVGAVLLLVGRWRLKIIAPITILLTIVFTLISIAKINFGTLMPALRSWWFVPHLFIYMVAYALMALALVSFVIAQWRHSKTDLPELLTRSSSALLVIGMLAGSVWARQAWGDYWAWDAKENWAAVTWFISLIVLHLRDRRGAKAIVIVLMAFIALQITWYGVNYLPSSANSIHTYNS